MIKHCVAFYSARIFAIHPFLKSLNFETQGCNTNKSNGLNLFPQIREIVQEDVGHLHLFITVPQVGLISSTKLISSSISLNNSYS